MRGRKDQMIHTLLYISTESNLLKNDSCAISKNTYGYLNQIIKTKHNKIKIVLGEVANNKTAHLGFFDDTNGIHTAKHAQVVVHNVAAMKGAGWWDVSGTP